jgi:HD superfamily phosphodiesterase
MKELVTCLHKEVIEYFAETDIAQISHTEAVHNFAQLIASLENCNEYQQSLIEMSALLHDIGCPNAKKKYGNTNPPNQEKEGKPLAKAFLDNYPMPDKDKELLAEVVGAHHHLHVLRELGFEILAEADLIVNLLEGYYKMEQAQHLYECFVSTKSGKELYYNMFLKK